MEVIIENVRSFHKQHTIPVRPITLLVGENSAGKSTFLAMLAALSDSTKFPFALNFNSSPYELGNYENIATKRSTSGKAAPSFRLGMRGRKKDEHQDTTAIATYEGQHGRINLTEYTVEGPHGRLDLKATKREAKGTIRMNSDNDLLNRDIPFVYQIPDARGAFASQGFVSSLLVKLLTDRANLNANVLRQFTTSIFGILGGNIIPTKSSQSIAPIRSKPRRTYDQLNEGFHPEGDHIPMRLANLLGSLDAEDQKTRESLHISLQQFGQDAGLFDSVSIKHLGGESNAAFRVTIKQDGLDLNLIDVGYGVSQVLPILVESLLAKSSRMFLLQQPEVHLHPRAQASLGTFFCGIARARKTHFVIETHSDYLLDRVRQEVAKGKIQSHDVIIHFFEKNAGRTIIHPITLDTAGNVVGAPASYRNFFLQEELNLLTRVSS